MKLKRRIFLRNSALLGVLFPFHSSVSATTQICIDDEESKSIFSVIKNRRSVRKFKPDPVPKGDIEKILELANYAPSPRNRQAWKFLVIDKKEILEKIKDECIKMTGDNSREYYTNYLSAPVYVLVLANTDTRNPENDIIAGALAAENLMLAARALGYGTVYCANSIPEEVTKQILKIPDNYKRLCITPIGVPEKWPEPPAKKSLGEVVLYNSFS